MTSNTFSHEPLSLAPYDDGNCFADHGLCVGYSFVFDPSFRSAFIASYINPNEEFLEEETARRLVRGVDSSANPSFTVVKPMIDAGHLDLRIAPFSLVHPYNYFHCLIESLAQVIYQLETACLRHGDGLYSGIVHPNVVQAIYHATAGRDLSLIMVPQNYKITAKEVQTAPPCYYGSERLDGSLGETYFDHGMMKSLRAAFQKYWTPQSSIEHCYIFVRRQSGQRNVVNTDQIEAAVAALGYTVIDPSQMSLSEQIRIFSGAKEIMGPTGAWLANLIFVPEEARVTVFYPETCRANYSMWRAMGEIYGIEVFDHYCSVHTLNTYQPIHSDFLIDETDLALALNMYSPATTTELDCP